MPLLSDLGVFLSCTIVSTPNGQFLGCAIIEFSEGYVGGVNLLD